MHEELPQGVLPEAPPEVAEELTEEERFEARVTELTEANTRRELEAMAREMGLEPTKAEYPNKDSLARAIAEKELPEEEEVTKEAPAEEEAETE